MPVNMGESGPGFGCSCRAWRPGEPTPEQALKALARSANVTVETEGPGIFGERMFRAWTDPENQYVVVYDPNKPGGFCKHCAAILTTWAPWFRQLALGADDALADIDALTKQNRKMLRIIAKMEKQLGKDEA